MVQEIFPENVSAHDKTCMGCQRHKKDLLICISENSKFFDIFLSSEQLDELIVDLLRIKEDNKE